VGTPGHNDFAGMDYKIINSRQARGTCNVAIFANGVGNRAACLNCYYRDDEAGLIDRPFIVGPTGDFVSGRIQIGLHVGQPDDPGRLQEGRAGTCPLLRVHVPESHH